ncbi:MAG: alpha/beta fold hydrolase [Chloroflexi bacterium]|nr:alpha/beta fold hydrolase [Chloroflexota bacterium]
MGRWVIIGFVALVFAWITAAQAPDEVRVERESADGVTLVGDLYLPDAIEEPGAPAVLLMHMFGARRGDWEPLIEPLVDAGYAVLNVDLRGHGDSGGQRDWTMATQDVADWFAYLKEQTSIDPARLGVIGASIGSNLALIGCAAEPACLTAVALSPGLDYAGLMPEDALAEDMVERSALLVTSRGDMESTAAVRQMVTTANTELGVRILHGTAHGTRMFDQRDFTVVPLILYWLDVEMAAG